MKKNIIFVAITLLILVSLGIGLSYSMWNMSLSQDTNNVIATTNECFDVTLTNQSNAIKLENAYPISDTKGKTLTPFTFTVKNTCDMFASYSVSLESLKGSTLSSRFIKVMVNDNEPKILNTLDSTDTVNSGSVESRILAKGSLSKNSSKDYSIRLWIDYNTTLDDLNNEIKVLKSKIIIKAIPQGYTGETVFNFDYTGGEQVFTAPVSGTYKLETWGAQGGNATETYIGGLGSYSTGKIKISENQLIYINVGGQGSTSGSGDVIGGYNGGGKGSGSYCPNDETQRYGTSGGGATHISKSSGLLSSLNDNKDNILIVSGGGGGAFYFERAYGNGASAGGIKGTDADWQNKGQNYKMQAQGGTQTSGGVSGSSNTTTVYQNSAFGRGGARSGGICNDSAGGGGGYYGGGEGSFCPAAGGSGYIGNSLLAEKVMYCYNCEESSEESTKTISTTCNEETPTENCAKKGNGYARITLISIDE